MQLKNRLTTALKTKEQEVLNIIYVIPTNSQRHRQRKSHIICVDSKFKKATFDFIFY